MMTKEEKMEYIIRHYKLMTAKEIATKLGMSQWMVYDYIKQSGLRNKNREVYERGDKRKYDTSKNPDVEIPQDDPGKSRMVRVNRYTYIMVRPGENADERKERFQRLTGLY